MPNGYHPPRIKIIFITGNPGMIRVYDTFLNFIYEHF